MTAQEVVVAALLEQTGIAADGADLAQANEIATAILAALANHYDEESAR
jgi:hypothetical protein